MDHSFLFPFVLFQWRYRVTKFLQASGPAVSSARFSVSLREQDLVYLFFWAMQEPFYCCFMLFP